MGTRSSTLQRTPGPRPFSTYCQARVACRVGCGLPFSRGGRGTPTKRERDCREWGAAEPDQPAGVGTYKPQCPFLE